MHILQLSLMLWTAATASGSLFVAPVHTTFLQTEYLLSLLPPLVFVRRAAALAFDSLFLASIYRANLLLKANLTTTV